MSHSEESELCSHKVNDFLYRVTYRGNLAGYVESIEIMGETRFRSRLLHRKHARLGAWVGEFFTLEEAVKAFEVFKFRLEQGSVYDTAEREERRARRLRAGLWSDSKTL